MARLWAESGDINAALSTAKLYESDIYQGSAQADIARIQANTGDIASALKTADLITRPNYKCMALRVVGEMQITVRDLAGARKTLASAAKTAELLEPIQQIKGYEMVAIASAQVKAGDIAGAQKSVTFVRDETAL